VSQSTLCDCGKPGVSKDGSGWSCQGCKDAIAAATRLHWRLRAEWAAFENFDERIENRLSKQRRYDMKRRMAA
jgi:hypothetical protein